MLQFFLKGRRHDAAMLWDCQLLHSLQILAFDVLGQSVCIYGDPAYPLRIHLQAPVRNRMLTLQIAGTQSSDE